MAKIIVSLEISNLPTDLLAEAVANLLIEEMGASIVSLKVSTEFETIVL